MISCQIEHYCQAKVQVGSHIKIESKTKVIKDSKLKGLRGPLDFSFIPIYGQNVDTQSLNFALLDIVDSCPVLMIAAAAEKSTKFFDGETKQEILFASK